MLPFKFGGSKKLSAAIYSAFMGIIYYFGVLTVFQFVLTFIKCSVRKERAAIFAGLPEVGGWVGGGQVGGGRGNSNFHGFFF